MRLAAHLHGLRIMNVSRVVRFVLSTALIVAAVLKIGWPDPSIGQYPSLIGWVELVLGIGLLLPRISDLAVWASFLFIFCLVGFGIGQIARTGLGTLSEPCGCLGAAVDPTRGVMLVIASLGLVLAAWLAFPPQPVERTESAGRRPVAVLALLGFAVVLTLSWTGALGVPRVQVRASDTHGGMHASRDSEINSPRLQGRSPVERQTPPVVRPSVPTAPPNLLVSVRDAASHRPLDGVSVWIAHSGHRATTSSSGEARLPLESEGPHELLAVTPSGVWARTDVPEGANSAVVDVALDARLAGRVVSPDGEDLADFRMQVLSTGHGRTNDGTNSTPTWDERRVTLDVVTDSDGRFEVPGLAGEAMAGLHSLDDGVVLLPNASFPAASGTTWVMLPATNLELVAVSGLQSSIDFVDQQTGGPVADLAVSIDWPQELTAYSRAQALDLSHARMRFVWPLDRGTPLAITGRATARGYTARTFELRERPDDGKLIIRMAQDASGRLTVRHPWRGATSARRPTFAVYCDGRSITADALGRADVSTAQESGQWVFAGLPSGRCSVRCYGVEIAAADMAPGESASVQARLTDFSCVVLRLRRAAGPLSGIVRVITQGQDSSLPLQARSRLELPEDGTIELFPIPAGTLKVTIDHSDVTTSPRPLIIEVPGGGETVAIDVGMVPR